MTIMFKQSRRFVKRFRSIRKNPMRAFRAVTRHPFAVPFLTFAILFLVSGLGFVSFKYLRHPAARTDAKIVIISHDHTQQILPSRESNVGALLKKINVVLTPGDIVEPDVTANIDQDDFRINIYRAVPVQVVDGTKISYTFSAAKTARSIAQQANAVIYPEDTVATQPVEDFARTGAIGERVMINRSVAVNLNLYGTPLALRTHASTVGDLIQQKKIALAKDDQVTPDAATLLTPNTQIFIVRNGTKIESVTETIAMPIESVSDPSLAYGTNAVRQVGSAGKQVTTYQETLRNDRVVGRTLIQTVVTQQPVTQIVVIGSSLSGIKGDMALAGIAPGDYEAVDYIVSHESGWCPTKAQGQYGGCPPYAGSVSSFGGYGLCQSTPGQKMASAGADWATNPVTQLRWCSGYANSRYGNWGAAYAHWLNNHNW